jgi:hypothetical protein
MLYPRETLERFISGDAGRARLVWELLSGIGSDVFRACGRVYGGGLYKLEPKELANVPVTQLAELLRS